MFDNADFEIAIAESGANVLLNIENVEYRVDEWKAGKIRVLFVVGFSGSGKTTVAREICAETGAKLVSLDHYLKALMRSKGYDVENDAAYLSALFSDGVDVVLQDNPTGQLVVEGAQITRMDPLDLAEHAVLVIGTSFLASTWRAALRDFEREHWERYGHIAPHYHTHANLRIFKPMGRLLRALQQPSEQM